MLTAALHAFDWSLGLRYSALLASPIWYERLPPEALKGRLQAIAAACKRSVRSAQVQVQRGWTTP